MKKVIVGSTNPVKIKAALMGFQKMFPDEEFAAEGVSVESGVGHQPRGHIETYNGAHLRMINTCIVEPEADFCVGIEGGIEDSFERMMAFAWIAIRSREGRVSWGQTGMFLVPPKIAELVNQGKGLGGATDIFFSRKNSKQEDSIVGILTDGAIDRVNLYVSAVVLALIPFKHPELY